MKAPSDKLSIEEICKILSIETPDKFYDRNIDNCQCQIKGEEYWDEYKREYLIAEYDYTCEVCSFDYEGKVISFFGKLLDHYHLKVVVEDTSIGSDLPYRIEAIEPRTGWVRAAKELIETINGVGYFYFSSIQDGLNSGPYDSVKDFVLYHLHWTAYFFEVYEGGKASNRFSRYLDSYR